MNFLRKLPIRSQLLIIAVSVIIVSTALFALDYFKTADIVKENSKSYTNDMFINMQESIASNCDSLNRILTGTAYNSIIQEYLLETDVLAKLNMSKKVNNFLHNMIDIKDGIMDIVITGDNGNYFDINGGSEFCRNLKLKVPEKVAASYSPLIYADFSTYRQYCFVISTNIYSTDKDRLLSGKIGTLYILVKPEAIQNQSRLQGKKSNEKIYLLDKDLKVFSLNSDADIGSNFTFIGTDMLKNKNDYRIKVDKDTYSIKTDRLPQINGYIVSVTPERALLSEIVNLRQAQMIIFFIAMIILAIPFIMVINNITLPLKKIMKFMKSIRSGNLKNLEKRIDLQGYSEMSVMAREFNSMMDEIYDLTHRLLDTSSRLYESELDKKKFELAMLKSQINPHFLYNTLESIKGLAIKEGIADIRDMAKSLGKMFQYSIKGDDLVSFKDELNIVKSYMQIQQIRFRDRFVVDYEISEDILECYVIKMILQPIVENAIYHGLEPKKGIGRLSIMGEINDENELLLTIRDDGAGIEPDILERLKEILAAENSQESRLNEKSGIGITNVNSRIKFTYGNNYGCQVESVFGMYTEVTVKLPVRREKYV